MLWPLDFEIWQKYLVVTTFFAMLGDIDLIFGMRVYNHKLTHATYQISSQYLKA
jgi:hypothetical protein